MFIVQDSSDRSLLARALARAQARASRETDSLEAQFGLRTGNAHLGSGTGFLLPTNAFKTIDTVATFGEGLTLDAPPGKEKTIDMRVFAWG